MKVTVTQHTVYGREIFHPVNDTAKAFARIAGTKTLTRETLTVIARDLKIEIEVTAATATFGKEVA